jgi:hypothetical protein
MVVFARLALPRTRVGERTCIAHRAEVLRRQKLNTARAGEVPLGGYRRASRRVSAICP